jgi:Ca2+-binding RTX toxin-like protein
MTAPRPTASISFNDPSNQLADLRAQIVSNVDYAWQTWSSVLNSAANIEIGITVASVGRANGGAASNDYLGPYNGLNLYQGGPTRELATGRDVTGANPDIVITIDPAYARSELWLDPTPGAAPAIPTTRTDAVSIFVHEIGHGLGFNGWRDGTTGALPGNYLDTFDLQVVNPGNGPVFAGPTATAVFGGAVPLTLGNYGHYGNVSAPPGADPLAGLMNGVTFYRGTRYGIGDLDLAILTDVGDPILVRRAGTEGADALVDGVLASEIVAGLGNDAVRAGGGNDIVYGNQGADLIYGNLGDDRLFGGQDNDAVFGGQGADVVYGNFGTDAVYGNLGDDVLYGGQGDDVLYGGQGNDLLFGNLGDDVLYGNLGADRFAFGANSGRDLVVGFDQGQGDRLLLGGQSYTLGTSGGGNALLILSGGGTVELAGIAAAAFNGGAYLA